MSAYETEAQKWQQLVPELPTKTAFEVAQTAVPKRPG